MRKQIDEETKQLIIKMHEGGATLGEISNQVPFSVNFVRCVLINNVVGYGKNPATDLTAEILQQIASRIREGSSIAKQSEKYGVTDTQLRYRFKLGNYNLQKIKYAKNNMYINICELRNSGKTLQQISEAVGLSRKRICEYLQEAVKRGDAKRLQSGQPKKAKEPKKPCNRFLNEKTRQQILQLYKNGEKYTDISAAVGKGKSTIIKVIGKAVKAGTIAPRNRSPRSRTAE